MIGWELSRRLLWLVFLNSERSYIVSLVEVCCSLQHVEVTHLRAGGVCWTLEDLSHSHSVDLEISLTYSYHWRVTYMICFARSSETASWGGVVFAVHLCSNGSGPFWSEIVSLAWTSLRRVATSCDYSPCSVNTLKPTSREHGNLWVALARTRVHSFAMRCCGLSLLWVLLLLALNEVHGWLMLLWRNIRVLRCWSCWNSLRIELVHHWVASIVTVVEIDLLSLV